MFTVSLLLFFLLTSFTINSQTNICSNNFTGLLAQINIIESLVEIPASVLPCGVTIITPEEADNYIGSYTISKSGNYCLAGDITNLTYDVITINANNVTLDLNGFSISGSISYGININSNNVTIKNGTISNCDGAGIAMAGGNQFITVMNLSIVGNNGVAMLGEGVSYLYMKQVTCAQNRTGGVLVQSINGRIEDCIFDSNGSGLNLRGTNNVIRNCAASSNGLFGFNLTDSAGLYCENCIAKENSGGGFIILGAQGCVMENCVATANKHVGFVSIAGVIAGGVLHNCIADNTKHDNTTHNKDGFNFPGNNMIIRHCVAENNAGVGFNQDGAFGAGQYYDNVACNNAGGNYDPSINAHSPGGVIAPGANFAAGYNLDCSA